MAEYEEKLDNVMLHVRELLLEKHHDYGEENLLAFGEYGVLIRSSDKVARLKNLIETGENFCADEKTEDTWRDLAGYALQALVMFHSDEDILETMEDEEEDPEDAFNQIMEDIEKAMEEQRKSYPGTTMKFRWI
jgi:hypothetical protein